MKLQINERALVERNPLAPSMLVTPPLDETFWLWRVPVSRDQAIVAFPKFGTVGCGFQHEHDDWNTNLPISCSSEEIYNHIKRNKGDRNIKKADCIKAIEIIRKAVKQSQ